MPMRIIDSILNDAVDLAVDEVDVGAQANGQLELWSGSPPANITDAPAGDLLAVIDFANPAFNNGGTTNTGEAEALGVPIATTGITDGTIGFVRVLNADQNNAGGLWDDDNVGTSGTRVVFNTLSVTTGVDVELTAYVFTATPTTLTP